MREVVGWIGLSILGGLVLVGVGALIRAAVKDERDARFALGALVVLLVLIATIWGLTA